MSCLIICDLDFCIINDRDVIGGTIKKAPTLSSSTAVGFSGSASLSKGKPVFGAATGVAAAFAINGSTSANVGTQSYVR